MIAIITSTLIPVSHSFYSVTDRYTQTINTVQQLMEVGFEKIILIDNSISPIDHDSLKLHSKSKLQIFQTPQYSFENKGLSEALLILNHLHNIPDDEIIFKISGRYYPNKNFDLKLLLKKLNGNSIVGVCHNPNARFPFFSTRAYLTKDKRTLETILNQVLEEMIAYGRDTDGFKGLVKKILNLRKRRVGTPFTLSLEQSFARVLKTRGDYCFVNFMNIEGLIAGSTHIDYISE